MPPRSRASAYWRWASELSRAWRFTSTCRFWAKMVRYARPVVMATVRCTSRAEAREVSSWSAARVQLDQACGARMGMVRVPLTLIESLPATTTFSVPPSDRLFWKVRSLSSRV
jgi:hypothetical protein